MTQNAPIKFKFKIFYFKIFFEVSRGFKDLTAMMTGEYYHIYWGASLSAVDKSHFSSLKRKEDEKHTVN